MVGFHTENAEVSKKGFTLLRKTFSIDFDNNLSEKQLFTFLEKMDAIEQESLDNVTNRICCRRAFIRGAFLAVGSASDPEKGYHLEFVCEEEEQAKLLHNLLGTDATVRASLYFYNTKEEVDAFVEACKKGSDFLDAFFA